MVNTRHFLCDDETGETITYFIDKETGEPLLENNYTSTRDAESVPKTNLAKIYIKFSHGYLTGTRKFQSIKENIIAGSNTISYRMLLIPTLLIFPDVVCVLLVILEVFLHVACHKKNKTLNDPNLYYRSPFHIVSSVFCGVCRESDSASKIRQLQDQRRYHYDYLKGIAI